MGNAVATALEYARTNLQAVRIVWVDREPEVYDAVGAVTVCSCGSTAGRIVAAVAQDKRFEGMLNRLIDTD